MRSLVNALAEESRALDLVAVELLGQIGPDAAEPIPALTEMLQDEEEAVRLSAAEALKKIRSHEHSPPHCRTRTKPFAELLPRL